MKPFQISLVLTLFALLPACTTYKLRGVVFYGSQSKIEVVDDDDPRIAKGSPIEEAAVTVLLDPNSLRNRYLGQTFPNALGEFAVPVDEPGAGVLQYEVWVMASAPGFSDAEITAPLPGSGERLLTLLAPGNRRVQRPNQLLDEFERNKRQFD